MKKIISAILIAIMLIGAFCLVSCTDGHKDSDETEAFDGTKLVGKTPKELYRENYDKVCAMTNFDLDITNTTVISYLGEEMSTEAITNVYKTDGASTYYTQSGASKWFVDGVLYTENNDQKEKVSVSADDFKNKLAMRTDALMLPIGDVYFNNASFYKDGENYFVSFEIVADDYEKYTGLESSENAICIATFSATGEIISFSESYFYTSTGDFVMEMTNLVEFKNIGSVEPISAPDDAESYRNVVAASDISKSALQSLDGVRVSAEKTDYVMLDVEGYGKMVIKLYPEVAPQTVSNFKDLVYNDFYTDLIFHRVVSDIVVQGGDPNGDGTGGSENKIKGEFSSNGFTNNLSHTKGVVSMARSADENSASSQFFIVLNDQVASSFDGNYAAFGYVIYGMDTVEKIAVVEVNEKDKPLTDIKINSAEFVTIP